MNYNDPDLRKLVELERRVALLDASNKELREKHGVFRDHIRKLEAENFRNREALQEEHALRLQTTQDLTLARNTLRRLYDWAASYSSPDTRWEAPMMAATRKVLGIGPKTLDTKP